MMIVAATGALCSFVNHHQFENAGQSVMLRPNDVFVVLSDPHRTTCSLLTRHGLLTLRLVWAMEMTRHDGR